MPSSNSTATSETEFGQIIEIDANRYKRKGYGLISAAILTFTFFYILPNYAKQIYADHIAEYSPEVLYFLGSNVLHITVFGVGNLVMALIYYIEHPFFEKYKILEGPWPWHSEPEKFRDLLNRTLFTVISNALLLLPAIHYIDYSLNGVTKDLSIEGFPSSSEFTAQIVFFMIVEDTGFYWMHRILHTPLLYRYIHKQHHQYTITIGLASEYAHPVEVFLANLLPTSLGPILMGSKCHIFTYWMWLVLRITETIDGHCGYEFSWSPFRLLPLSGSASYHNYHHSHNTGNYGSFFTYWDTICGTNKYYNRYIKRIQLAEDKYNESIAKEE